MTSGVYLIEGGGAQYVGSAKDIVARWSMHRHELNQRKHHSRYLQRAWDKYGSDAFTFCILEECEPEQCIEREQYWIDTLKPKFNMHPLARSPLGVRRSAATRAKLSALASARNSPPMQGKHHSEETRAKMRGRVVSDETRAKLRGRVVDEETRAKLRTARSGKPRPRASVEAAAEKLRGRKRAPEVGKRISESLTGVKHSDERREKNRTSHLGQVISEEQRSKISASLKGRLSPLKGRKLTPEHRAKVVAALDAHRNQTQGSEQRKPE
jgi:group I intron endonuclease